MIMAQRFKLQHAVFAVYLYLLIKIILFKFNAIDLTYLIRQLGISWHEPARVALRIQQGNLMPFHEIASALEYGTSHGFVNLFGNIAIFMPFGLLLGLLGSRRGERGATAMHVLAQSFGLSLSLEISQAVFSMGTFDVDDMILNSFGGLAGFMVHALFAQLREIR